MARAADQLVIKDTVRITVITTDTRPTDDPAERRAHHVDLSMSTSGTLADTAIEAAQKITKDLKDRRIDAGWLTDPDSELVLAPLVGEAWDQDETLGQVGLTNGKIIVLTTQRANERYPRLFESLADGAAEIRAKNFAAWDTDASHDFAAKLMPAGVGVLSVLGASAAVRHDGLIQWVLVAVFGVAALIVSLAAVTTAQYQKNATHTPALGLSMHALLAATAASAIPSEGWSVWNFAAAAVVVTASAWGMVALKAPTLWTHIAVLTGALSLTIGLAVTLLYGLWRDVPPSGAAAMVATIAFMFFMGNVPLARKFARLDMPALPTPEEDIDLTQTHNLAQIAREMSEGEKWDSLIHQEDRNIGARYASLGIMLGSGVVAALAATVAGATITDATLRYIIPEFDGRWVGIVTFAVLSALFILRGTWNIDRGLCSVGIISGVMVATGYIGGVAVFGRDDSLVRVAGMVIIGLAILLLACYVMFSASDRPTSEKRVKALQILEAVLLVLVWINALAMINVFFSVRSR